MRWIACLVIVILVATYTCVGGVVIVSVVTRHALIRYGGMSTIEYIILIVYAK